MRALHHAIQATRCRLSSHKARPLSIFIAVATLCAAGQASQAPALAAQHGAALASTATAQAGTATGRATATAPRTLRAPGRGGTAQARLLGMGGVKPADACNPICPTLTYSTPGTYSLTIPVEVSEVVVSAIGAAGGAANGASVAYGGEADGLLAVTPGEQLQINVGGAGSPVQAGGFNGGGDGGNLGAGGGGGASDIRIGSFTLADREIVAGGGGGDGNETFCNSNAGGAGGGTTGGTAQAPIPDPLGGPGTCTAAPAGAGGGTQTTAGDPGPTDGLAGDVGQFGGQGNDAEAGGAGAPNGGGGGGGGWYGGGGGGAEGFDGMFIAGGGGGGSSYFGPDLKSGRTQSGDNPDNGGNGEVTISYTITPGIVTLSAGYDNVCALTGYHTVFCWGRDDAGQSDPPTTYFSQISLGFTNYGCGVRLNNSAIQCWGQNQDGQTDPPSTGTFTSVYAMPQHACAIESSGSVQCWGLNDSGQSTPPAGSFTQLSGGSDFTCGLQANQSVTCWGTQYQPTPSGTFTQISSGAYYTCGLRTDQTIACWGSQGQGAVTPPAGTFTAISAGDSEACAVSTSGPIKCWSDSDISKNPPPPSLPGSPFTTLATGGVFECAYGFPLLVAECTENPGATGGDARPVLTPTTLPSTGTVGQPYSGSLSTTYENPPAYYHVGVGSLPPGVTLDPDGTLSGAPTAAGTYIGAFVATNGAAPNALAPFSITVGAGPSTTTVTSALNPALKNQQVTYTAAVTGVGEVPTGTVEFQDNGSDLPGCGAQQLNGDGDATCSVSYGPGNLGAHVITAIYGGDSSNDGSTGSMTENAYAQTQTYSFTGSAQTWTVPAGVTSASFILYGAQGGGYCSGGSLTQPGGEGGQTVATLAVTPGQVYQLNVGGQGSGTCGSAGSGFNGGGGGGSAGGGAGGGATDLRSGSDGLADRALVAGGGGGAADIACGGPGGGSTGQTGCLPVYANGGGGGTQTAGGGPGGDYGDPFDPSLINQSIGGSGRLGQGGGGGAGGLNGGLTGSSWPGGGGGGGGFYGGGGGSGIVNCAPYGDANESPYECEGAGGGGSGYATSSATSVFMQTGVQQGNGSLVIDDSPQQASTSVALTSSVNPSVYGQPVTYTATVTVSPGVAVGSLSPTGSVSFSSDGSPVTCTGGTQTVNSSGTATCVASPPTGTHSVTATYAGDGNFQASTSSALSQLANQAGTTTTPASASATVGSASVSLSAAMTAQPPSPSTVGEGTVTFSVQDVNGNQVISPVTVAVSGGAASGSASLSGVAAGAYTITATYSGGTDFAPSNGQSTLLVTSPGVTVTQTASATADGGSATASTPASGGGKPDISTTVSGTGTVTVAEYSSDPVSTPVPASGTYVDVHLSAGNALTSATITRCNMGSGNTTVYWWSGTAWTVASPQSYNPSSGCVTIGPLDTATTSPTLGQLTSTPMVDAQAEPTQVQVSPVSGQYGGSVALNAAIAPATGFSSAGSLAGTVTFTASGQTLGTATVTADGTASTQATVTVGVNATSVTATYTPAQGSAYAGSGSTAALTVTPAPLTITADSKTRAFGAPNPAFTATPAGLVNGDTLASLGTLTFSTPATTTSQPGSYTITAGGASDANYSITYQPGTLTVTQDAATITLGSSGNSSLFGQAVTYTATVAAAPPGSGTPAGTVTFYDGTNALATVPLSGGTATLTTGALPGGTQSLTARYSGNTDFTGATSAALAQTVTFTSAISGTVSAPLTVAAGQSVLITGTVAGPVTVKAGGALVVKGGTVGGPVSATGATALALCGATVKGKVTVSASTGYLLIGAAADEPAFGCTADTITGPLSVSGNKGGLAVDGNSVTGPVSVTSNTGSEPIAASADEIEANTIAGPLSCSANNPPPVDGGLANKASGGKNGQCAGL